MTPPPEAELSRAGEVDSGLPLWCRVENLLSPTVRRTLFEAAVESADGFGPSRTLTSTFGYRRSSVLRKPTFVGEFMRVLRMTLPMATQALGVRSCDPDRILAEITVHHDGDFYRIHRDDGHPDVRHRVVSFAYYFHNEPRLFTGGELVLYEYGVQRDAPDASRSTAILPAGNTIVLFPSCAAHAVRPVSCDYGRFDAGRFTINGWVSR